MEKIKIIVLLCALSIIFFSEKNSYAQSVCSGSIEVLNSKDRVEFRENNTFTITVKNTGPNSITGTIVDEVFHDINCNGIDDRQECSSIGLSSCGWGIDDAASKQWDNVSLTPGETKQLNWSSSNWIPGFCFIHNVYLYSTPLNSTNSCWKGNSEGWQDAVAGNLKHVTNTSGFSSFSSMSLLEGTEYGFVTHLDFAGVEAGLSTQNLEHFKKDVDQWVSDSSKIRIVRIAAHPWDIVASETTTEINWNQTNLSKIDEALNYALQKGFKIILTLGPHDNSCGWQTSGTPDCGYGDYIESAYNNYVSRFYSYLAERWRGKIFIWSPYNESDLSAFTHYFGECKTRSVRGWCQIKDPPPNLLTSDGYLNSLNSALHAIKVAIKAKDPSVLIMVHLGSPMNVWYYTTNNQIERVLDNVDVLGISLYPGNIESNVNNIPNILDYFRGKFNKPVYLVETGMPENDAAEPEPRSSKTVNFLSKANKHTNGALYYQFRDDFSNLNETPLFGVRKTDETLKPSYNALINYMNNSGWVESKQFQKGWNYIYWSDFNENQLPPNCQKYSIRQNFFWKSMVSGADKIYISCN